MSATTEERVESAPSEQPREDAALRDIFPEYYAEDATPADAPAEQPRAAEDAPADEPTEAPAAGRDSKGRFLPKGQPAEQPEAAPETPAPEATPETPDWERRLSDTEQRWQAQLAERDERYAQERALWQRQQESYRGEIQNAANRARQEERAILRDAYAGDPDSLRVLEERWAAQDGRAANQQRDQQLTQTREQMAELLADRHLSDFDRETQQHVADIPNRATAFVREVVLPHLKTEGLEATVEDFAPLMTDDIARRALAEATTTARYLEGLGMPHEAAFRLPSHLGAALAARSTDVVRLKRRVAALEAENADLKDRAEVRGNRERDAGDARYDHTADGGAGAPRVDLDELVKRGDTDAVTRELFADYYRP